MDSVALRAIQAPLKKKYREDPAAACLTLKARGTTDDESVACRVETARAIAVAGLHRATGGSGADLCSGDLLLEALVACAGVTLKAVAIALDIDLRKGVVKAEGDLDFRGTLGIDRDVPVGFKAIRMSFEIDSDAPAEKLEQLVALTERYCVIFQSLNQKPELSVTLARS
jgi:uncharacterized OsmC-like protein